MTLYIVIISCIVSFIAFQNQKVSHALIFNPYLVAQNNEWYRFVTSGIIHADFIHLLVNMFVLYSFGGVVEDYFGYLFGTMGTYYFLVLYLGGLLVSIVPSFVKHKHNPHYNALGASGAVSAVVFSYIIFQPLQKIYLYGLIGIPGIVAGVLYLGYSWYMGKKGGGNINHDAHLWGALFGIVLTIGLKPSLAISFVNELKNFSNYF